ncbi:MAG TPA: GxxExxY protein [Rhizomicrobium sp.]|jgi:iron complex transport system substrate-binding protein|nr:GxxExxY protein [Rhizomicrobium sp.]
MTGDGGPLNAITGEIVDAAYKLHCALGPGLLESVYEQVLMRDLERRGLRAARQIPVSFEYDGLNFEEVCRVDILVENRIVVEIKSLERLAPVHPKQLLTYLRLLQLPLGLLINFGAPTLKEGIHRVANTVPSSASLRLRVNQLPSKGSTPADARRPSPTGTSSPNT